MSTESSRRHLLGLAVAGAAGSLAAACARSQAATPGAAAPAGTEPSVSQAELDKLKGLALRVVRPGEAVTMDFRADRLTVEVDGSGQILRASIG